MNGMERKHVEASTSLTTRLRKIKANDWHLGFRAFFSRKVYKHALF